MVIFNIVLYVVLLFKIWTTYNKINVYFFIALLYGFTAVMCSLHYQDNISIWTNLSYSGFIYLYVVLLIMLAPLSKLNMRVVNFANYDSKELHRLALVYIIVGLIDISFSLPHTLELFSSGEWGALREQLYADEESVELYSSQWERLVKNFVSYLSPFALVYGFMLLTKEHINKVFTFLLFVTVLGPSFLGATVVASRGMLVIVALKLCICYLIFKDQIPQNRKKYVMQMAVLLLAGYLTYSIIVSISRFGQDEAGNSIFMYFGHSMLTFNQGIYESMHDFAWGKRFFSWFIDLFGGDSYFNSAKLGSTAGTGFLTIVGCMYVDWGPIGSLIVAIIANRIVTPFFKSNGYRLSDIVVIVFYASTMAEGIMVFGKGRALAWASIFVVYFIVRKIENKTN